MPRLTFAFRSLVRTPVISLAVIASLGLGIGANSAIFSLVHQIMLRPLPVPEPDRIVLLTSPSEFKGGRQSTSTAGGLDYVFSYPAFRALEAEPRGVTGVASYRVLGANLAINTTTSHGSVMVVSGGYFTVLEVVPHLGRLISPQDDVHGAGQAVAVLGHHYWKHRLGADPAVLGRTLQVNGHPFTVVGVLPPQFSGVTLGDNPEVMVPLSFKPLLTPGWDGTDRQDDYWLYLLARLEPGSSRERAEAGLNQTFSVLMEEQAVRQSRREPEYLERLTAARLTLLEGRNGHSQMREESETPLTIMTIATILVLLIAMANAVNLLLVKTAQRRRELVVRLAMGAHRRHLVGQLITETMLLAVAGGLLGLLLGKWTLDLLIARLSSGESTDFFLQSSFNQPVLLFTLGLSLLAGLLLGLYPALEASRGSLTEALKEGAQQSSPSRGAARARTALVIAQVTISVVLLVPTGLFLKSLVNLTRVDLGFDKENLILFRVSPERNGYSDEDSRALFLRMEQELARLPGVNSVTASMVPIMSGSNWGNTLTVEGHPSGPEHDTHAMFNVVSPNYFNALGVPLLAGREFTPRDDRDAPRVAIVNETFARHFFEGENPIGRRFGMGWGDVELDVEIVGLTRDTHYSGVRQDRPRLYYQPWYQMGRMGALSFYLRTALPPAQVMPALRGVMAELDPQLPLENLTTMVEQVRRNTGAERLMFELSAAFAIVATVLAMLGLYGLMAYSVTQRHREIGIRMSLGAGGAQIVRMIMRQVMLLMAIGIGLGVPLTLGVLRFIESQLFGVSAYDIRILVAASAALLVAGLAAGLLPARKATRVDPAHALRYD